MTIANEFYDRADYTRALEYYRSIRPLKSLQEKTNQAIANLQQRMKQTSRSGYSIHLMYIQERIEALTAAHQSLTNSADNRAALYLKMGQCWLLKGATKRPSFCLADSVQAILFHRNTHSSTVSLGAGTHRKQAMVSSAAMCARFYTHLPGASITA